VYVHGLHRKSKRVYNAVTKAVTETLMKRLGI
jgi:hypothetical protein